MTVGPLTTLWPEARAPLFAAVELCNVNNCAMLELPVLFFQKLHLSEDVAGATFMAAGSSTPELFASVIGTEPTHWLFLICC